MTEEIVIIMCFLFSVPLAIYGIKEMRKMGGNNPHTDIY